MLKVIAGDVSVSYRVKWTDGAETLISPVLAPRTSSARRFKTPETQEPTKKRSTPRFGITAHHVWVSDPCAVPVVGRRRSSLWCSPRACLVDLYWQMAFAAS